MIEETREMLIDDLIDKIRILNEDEYPLNIKSCRSKHEIPLRNRFGTILYLEILKQFKVKSIEYLSLVNAKIIIDALNKIAMDTSDRETGTKQFKYKITKTSIRRIEKLAKKQRA